MKDFSPWYIVSSPLIVFYIANILVKSVPGNVPVRSSRPTQEA